MNKKNKLWITWERQRRNINISKAINFELIEIRYHKPKLIRYIKSIVRTAILILTRKPKVVAAQNPSIILSFLVVILKKFFKYKVIIDAHNSGLFPLEGSSRFLSFISDSIHKYSNLTLVTNSMLKSYVDSKNGHGFILPDKIPFVPEIQHCLCLTEKKIHVAFICTYKDDEPYKKVLEASGTVSDGVIIYFTGKFEGKINPREIPKNVRLLGFVPEVKYWELLSSVDIVIGFTTREACLVCGAYEAVALEKPLILSNTSTQKKILQQRLRFCISNIRFNW